MSTDRISMALRGPVPQADGDPGDPAQQQTDQPSGSAQSGYATPDLGPFECDNCVHFEAPNRCNQSQVVSDPEVQGNVDAEGCCNLFTSAHKESQQEEHSEGLEE
jgi:hypothetical protein